MASVKNKRFLFLDANGTDASDMSKCSAIFEVKIIDSEGDVVLYPSIRIAADLAVDMQNLTWAEIIAVDAALIASANPF